MINIEELIARLLQDHGLMEKTVMVSVFPLKFFQSENSHSLKLPTLDVTIEFRNQDILVESDPIKGPDQVDPSGNVHTILRDAFVPYEYRNLHFAVVLVPVETAATGNVPVVEDMTPETEEALIENEADKKIRSAVAIINILEQNRSFQSEMARFIYTPDRGIGQISTSHPVPIYPFIYKTYSETLKFLNQISPIDLGAGNLSKGLRWFYRSLTTDDPTSKFLNAWIACEALVEHGESDVRYIVNPLHQSLSRDSTYQQKAPSDTKAYLFLGRLSSVRGNVAHNGEDEVVTEFMATYAQIIFAELFFAVNKLDSPGILKSFNSDAKARADLERQSLEAVRKIKPQDS